MLTEYNSVLIHPNQKSILKLPDWLHRCQVGGSPTCVFCLLLELATPYNVCMSIALLSLDLAPCQPPLFPIIRFSPPSPSKSAASCGHFWL